MCIECKEKVCNFVQFFRLGEEINKLKPTNSDKWIVYDHNGDEIEL